MMHFLKYIIIILGIITTSACAPTTRVNISETQVNELMRKAAEGDAKSQAGLGFLFYDGVGVRQDYAEVLKWWGYAAEAGNAVAQAQLGLMYITGKGAPQSYTEAKR